MQSKGAHRHTYIIKTNKKSQMRETQKKGNTLRKFASLV